VTADPTSERELRRGIRAERVVADGATGAVLVAVLAVGLDLFFSFGGTQGMKVDGTATWNHGRYVGNITYVITDSYGWNSNGTGVPFWNDFRPKMHWLQTHCGAPAVKGGPKWFKSGVTVKVPIR